MILWIGLNWFRVISKSLSIEHGNAGLVSSPAEQLLAFQGACVVYFSRSLPVFSLCLSIPSSGSNQKTGMLCSSGTLVSACGDRLSGLGSG